MIHLNKLYYVLCITYCIIFSQLLYSQDCNIINGHWKILNQSTDTCPILENDTIKLRRISPDSILYDTISSLTFKKDLVFGFCEQEYIFKYEYSNGSSWYMTECICNYLPELFRSYFMCENDTLYIVYYNEMYLPDITMLKSSTIAELRDFFSKFGKCYILKYYLNFIDHRTLELYSIIEDNL